jgi:phytoene synthase
VDKGPPDDLVTLSEGIIRSGSKSFAAAARLFDRDTRASAYLLYAWCRHCDDVIDGQELGFGRARAEPHDPEGQLARLQRMTRAALDGEPMADPIFAAFQRVVAKHAIPPRYPLELIDGFAMDVTGRCYETIDDTLSYCYHVAGVVGVMMAFVMGVRDERTLDRACDLGLAFQLTNIARDVVDDARLGRVYLPASWLAEAGIPRDRLEDTRYRESLFGVVERLLDEAEAYYRSALIGMSALPLRSRWAVATARNVYREIGREVRRRRAQAWDQRASTTKAQKLAALATGAAIAVAGPIIRDASRAPPRGALWTRPRQ